MIIPLHILNIISKIEDAGFEGFAVGGCVRDSFLGKVPSDWDVTTSATPQEILDIFKDYKTIPTGLKHGTVTVLTQNTPVEVTTYRIDGEYTDNRHPKSVTFSRRLEDDLSRRDFTINAMAYNPQFGLIDPFDGKSDLDAGVIRCVGSPAKRFSEDALRILRALRFSAVLGFEIDSTAKDSIRSLSQLLANVSRERISAELCKLIVAPNAVSVLLEFCPLFAQLLGAPESLEAFLQNIPYLNNSPKDPIIRFSILLHRTDSLVAAKAVKDLRLDSKTAQTIMRLVALADTSLLPEPAYIKTFLSEYGEEIFEMLLCMKKSLNTELSDTLLEIKEIYNKIREENQCYHIKMLEINGNDLMQEFDIKGTEIGKLLNQLLLAVINGKCENSHDKLLQYAKIYII
ncbi:MAG: CCA tRNA nucleotidyltransferase [Clostridia bacterium]|nr:CCA tRNA nucleotidyltransferase [Clostridia bacterium]